MKKQNTISHHSKPTIKSIIILILVGILFAILTIEISTLLVPALIPTAVHLHFRDTTYLPSGLVEDELLGVKYPPDLVDFLVPVLDDQGQRSSYSVSTVSLGYQDIGFRDDGINGETFAVVIGDSYVGCVGVPIEACWVELLEHETGRDFANFGVPGYGPQQEQKMLANYGLPLDPEVVLWVFFANDPDDAWWFERFGKGGVSDGEFWRSPIKTWLVQNSTTYMLLVFFRDNYHFIYNLLTDNNDVPVPDNKYPLRLNKRVWWETITDPANPETVEKMNLTIQAILAAKQETQLAGKEFVVIIIPTREQVYYADTVLQSQLDALNDRLVDFCQRHDIDVVDLTSSLKAKAQNESLIYFKEDLHLNPKGNQIVANLLLQELEPYLGQ